MHLQIKDVTLYNKVASKIKNGRHYHNFQEEKAGLQLQQFTVQKTAKEHSEQNKNEILERAKHLGIPTVIITNEGMQFVGQSNVDTQELLTDTQIDGLNEGSENRWSSARWNVFGNDEGYQVLEFNCNYDMHLVLTADAGFYVDGVKVKNRYDQINKLWSYGYPAKRGRPIRLGRLGHSGSKQEIEHLVRWVEELKNKRTNSEISSKVMSIYSSMNRHYAWPEHW
jgi:hypothetical protein